MNSKESILLIRLKSIGDVAFTLPAVNAVRDNFPDAKITFLTSKENAPLLRGFREVAEAITLDHARFQSGNPRIIWSEAFSLLRRLRDGKFSLVIDFQGYGETEWLSWWSGAPERWGSVYRAARGWTYSRGERRNGRIHPVYWNLSLLQQCGLKIGEINNEFALPEDALAAAREFFSGQKLDISRPTLFIQPFSSSPQKNWPLENYLAVARHWRARGCKSSSAAARPTASRWNRPAPKASVLPPVNRCWFPLAWRNWPRSCSAATPGWGISPWPAASGW